MKRPTEDIIEQIKPDSGGSKLYACIISPDLKRDKNALLFIAYQFSHAIEVLQDGILFDISGLERLVGKPERIGQKVMAELKQTKTSGSVGVANNADTAMLLARQDQSEACTLNTPDAFQQLPLKNLDIEQDTLNVFNDLGLRRVEDVLAIPHDDLVNRYGREFEIIIRKIQQKGDRLIVPNVKEQKVSWSYVLDMAVEDFEQLIFILNHGLEILFGQMTDFGLSTEQLDISFKLSNKTNRDYEIKTSFPTLERSFWLKLVNLRVALDPPETGIVGMDVTAHFTKPRPNQRGLYAVSRPEPESLLLTINKIKKLVGEENVGVPVLVNQRLSEPFTLDADKLPTGKERLKPQIPHNIVAFSYFRPPVRAEVLAREGRLVFIKTRYFNGHVANYSGVWKGNSTWWDKPWKTQEWDVEIENNGVYRLCKVQNEWFVTGEYD